ncbi:hypothetical protein C8T65DRAFT_628930 [Cerioporus squamosus]|nr:hypothetical protein C8T65DRAFT_628930 [Cerioporus squamosus]
MSIIESVPTELWHEIIKQACTDGGYTGRSLALSSRFLHAQSLVPRFHSVALNSLRALEGFLSLLAKLPDNCDLRIEHLFICFRYEPHKTPPNSCRDRARMSRAEEQRPNDEEVNTERDRWRVRFTVAMSKLFVTVSPTLRTLCLVEEPGVRFALFPCPPLLLLEELTIKAYAPTILPIPDNCIYDVPATTASRAGSDDDLSSKLPVLRRLHYVPNIWSGPSSCAPVLAYLSTHAPRTLTHLRFSAVTNMDGAIVGQIPEALGLAFTDEQIWKRTALPPPVQRTRKTRLLRLQALVVQGNEPEPGKSYAFSYEVWEQTRMNLELLARRCAQETVIRMSVFSRPSQKNPDWWQRLYHEWVDRIEGQNGCWVHNEEEEALLEDRSDKSLGERASRLDPEHG